MGKKRICYLDLLRIIACFLVLFNHTLGYINCFKYDDGTSFVSVLPQLFIGMLIKVNVPLFFMISGTLLLGRDMTIKDTTRKAIRFFVILLIFSIAANIVYTGHFYIPGFVRNFASATVDGAGPYWYLYSYIAILLMAVFLRHIAANMTLEETGYIILVRLIVTGLLPMVILFLNRKMDSNMYIAHEFNPVLMVVDCVFYPLAGFGLDRLTDIKKIGTKGLCALVCLFFGANILESFLTWYAGASNVFSGFDFVMTIALFMVIRYLLTVHEPSDAVQKAITAVGRLTFGIYLLDPVIGTHLKPVFYGMIPEGRSLFGISVLYCVVSMIIGGLLTFAWQAVLRKAHIKVL